jgi:hypothetical protein
MKPISNQQTWALCLLMAVFIIGVTVMYVSSHPYVIRIEMDDNTLMAVQNVMVTADGISQRQDDNADRQCIAFANGDRCALINRTEWNIWSNTRYYNSSLDKSAPCCYPTDTNCTKTCVYPVGVWYGK